MPSPEKSALLSARDSLARACDKAAQLRFGFGAVTSPEGRAFARYIECVRFFYAEGLPAAGRQFATVGPAASSWLDETAA